jgi:hypothetical protein
MSDGDNIIMNAPMDDTQQCWSELLAVDVEEFYFLGL